MRSNPDTPVKTARERVAALRDALLHPTPEAIEACVPGLVEAAASIGAGIGAGDPAELRALQKELRAVQHLIEHGEKINQGLARILGARIAGYTPSGEAAPIQAAGTVCVEG